MSEKKDEGEERPGKRFKMAEEKTTKDIAPMSFVLGNRALPMNVANYILENFVYMSELTFCRLARNALQKYPRLLVDGRHLALADTGFIAQEMSRLQPHLQYVQYLHSVVPEGDECKLLTTLPRLKKLEVLLPAFAYSNRGERLQKLDTFWRAFFFPLQTRSLQEFILDVQVIAEEAHLHTNRSALKTEELVQKIIAQQKVQPGVDIQTLSLSTVGYRFTSAQDLLKLSEVLTGLRHVKLGVAWNQNANVLNMFDSLEQLETLQLESLEVDDIKNVFVRDVWIPTLDRFFLRHSKTLQRLALHHVRSQFLTPNEAKLDVFCDPSDQTLNVFQSYPPWNLLFDEESMRFLQIGVLKSAVTRFPNKKLKQVSVVCRQDVANCLQVLLNANLRMHQLMVDGLWQNGRKKQSDPIFNPLINPDQLSQIWKHLQLQILAIANFGLVVNTTTNGMDWPIDDHDTFPYVLPQTAAFCFTPESMLLPLVDVVLEAKCKHLVSTTKRIDFFKHLSQSKHAKQLLTVLSTVDDSMSTWSFANRTRNNDPFSDESYSIVQQFLANCSNVQTLDLAGLGPAVGDRLCREIQPSLSQLRHVFLHCSFNTNVLSCLEQLTKAHQQWEQVYFEVHLDSKEAKFVWIEHSELERFLDNQPRLVGFGVYFHYFELPAWSREELEKFKRGLSFQHKHPKLEKLLVHIWEKFVMVDELWDLFAKFPNLKQLTIVRRPVMGPWDEAITTWFDESKVKLMKFRDYVDLIPHWPVQLTSFDMCFENPEDSRVSRTFEHLIQSDSLYYKPDENDPLNYYVLRTVTSRENHTIGLAFRTIEQKQQFMAQLVAKKQQQQLESKAGSQASPFASAPAAPARFDYFESLESNEHARTRYNFLTDNLPFQHSLKIPVANQASTAFQNTLLKMGLTAHF